MRSILAVRRLRRCPVCGRRVRRSHHQVRLLAAAGDELGGVLAAAGLVRARVVLAHRGCQTFTDADAARILGPVP